MNLTRLVRRSLAAFAIAAPLAHAADPTVLRVGDQNYYNVRASVEASGVLEGAPYTVDWKHFQSAAPVAEGLDAGALDIGFLGDSGLIFLAANAESIEPKRAAIADFLGRLQKARAWVEANREGYADLRAKKANLDQAVSRNWIGHANMTVGPVDEQAARDYQETADFLVETGALKQNIDTSSIDTSFNTAFE